MSGESVKHPRGVKRRLTEKAVRIPVFVTISINRGQAAQIMMKEKTMLPADESCRRHGFWLSVYIAE